MKSETVKNLNQSLKEKELPNEKRHERITKSNYLVEKRKRGQTCQYTDIHQEVAQGNQKI